MCDACLRFLVRRAPACVRCAHERRTRARREKSLAVFVLLIGLASFAFTAKRGDSDRLVLAAVFGAGSLIASAFLLRAARRAGLQPDVVRRGDEPPPGASPEPTAAARRAARARRLAAILTPKLSARTTALVVLAAMAFAAVAFPVLLRLPRWLELEVVLSGWWLIAVALLTTVLYRGYRLEDDHFFHAPRMHTHMKDAVEAIGETGCNDPGCSGLGCDDVATAIGLLILLGLVVVASIVLAWVIVELALPLAFIAFYMLAVAAIRRAARDNHHCQCRLGLALLWGATWASVYFVPLAVLVFAVQHALAHAR